jgi:hypothetical protein
MTSQITKKHEASEKLLAVNLPNLPPTLQKTSGEVENGP